VLLQCSGGLYPELIHTAPVPDAPHAVCQLCELLLDLSDAIAALLQPLSGSSDALHGLVQGIARAHRVRLHAALHAVLGGSCEVG
jgi:hypothetical protein